MHSQKILGNQFAAEVTITDLADGSPGTQSEKSPSAESSVASPRHWPGLVGLLQPHAKLLALGLFAVVGEGTANLLEPWPL